MKTIITKEVQGFNVVVGFGLPVADPVATKKAAESAIKKSPEFQLISDLQSKIAGLSQMSAQSKKESTELRKKGKAKEADAKYQDFLVRQEQIKAKQAEIKKALPKFEAARNLVLASSAVYFEPKKGEFIVNEAQYQAASAAYSERGQFEAVALNQDLTVSVVPDYTGAKYWTNAEKWEQWPGPIFGEALPVDAILDQDLIDAQRAEIADQLETERVVALTQAEKDSELASLTDQAAARAAQMRSKLEIQGHPDPLGESQAWYQSQIEILSLKYA